MAFSFARDGDEDFEQVEDPGTLAVAQRAWTVERDACDANRDCLRNRMIDRVSAQPALRRLPELRRCRDLHRHG